MGRLDGRVAIITGGAQGIGEATARGMVAEGAHVVIADLQDDRGRHVAGQLGTAASFEHLDATVGADWRRVVANTEARQGRLDILVNAAGIAPVGPFDQVEEDQWDECMRVNTTSVFLGCRHAVEAMRRSGRGSIINFSSSAGKRARPEVAAYGAAKAAVSMFTRHVALRCGEAGYNIRCNAVLPGPILTPMSEKFLHQLVAEGLQPSIEAGKAMMGSSTALRRMASADEVARVVIFLASDDASYVTGVELPVDGGMCAF